MILRRRRNRSREQSEGEREALEQLRSALRRRSEIIQLRHDLAVETGRNHLTPRMAAAFRAKNPGR